MKQLQVTVLIAALCCNATITHASLNLIVNGDFESPVLGATNPNNIPLGVSPLLPGWVVGSVVNNPNVYVNVNHVGGSQSFWNPPHNSTQWMDLTGSTGGAYIEQTFATLANTMYHVTLDTFNGSLVYSTAGPWYAAGFSVSATGNSSLPVIVTPGIQQSVSYYFLTAPTTTTTTLRFSELTGVDSNAGWIDNVFVSAVPEASTLIAGALLLLPFGASTLRILRKRTV